MCQCSRGGLRAGMSGPTLRTSLRPEDLMQDPSAEPVLFEATTTPPPGLTPRGLRIIAAGVVIASAGIGILFAWLGAWPILGFVGAEAALVLGLLALHGRWTRRTSETLTLAGGKLTIRRTDPGLRTLLDPAAAGRTARARQRPAAAPAPDDGGDRRKPGGGADARPSRGTGRCAAPLSYARLRQPTVAGGMTAAAGQGAIPRDQPLPGLLYQPSNGLRRRDIEIPRSSLFTARKVGMAAERDRETDRNRIGVRASHTKGTER